MNVKDMLKDCACFGVAGNFTGHLEQAGEAADFRTYAAATDAPKAVFPTYIPGGSNSVPLFLQEFPFDEHTILFPNGEEHLQIEPECAVIFRAQWSGETIERLEPLCFGASNDCSIRKAGAKKISVKKNWGCASKGFSSAVIHIDSFAPGGILDRYRIASYLVRGGTAHEYGENSEIRGYRYMYSTLLFWLVDRLNNQTDDGPAENVSAYLNACGCPEKLMVSIGATRYTPFGERTFLQDGDVSVVVLYPQDRYSPDDIQLLAAQENASVPPDISVLRQRVVL